MTDFKEYYNSKKVLVDIELNSFGVQDTEKTIVEAMRYSLLANGKRFRPVLILMVDDLFKTSKNHHLDILKIASSLECLHTYSLIHDDLPAMDDDDLRRGLPTCHKKFDEETAILAGDGLLTASFEILSQLENTQNLPKIIQAFCQASGYQGMIGGQMLDIKSTHKSIALLEELKGIHLLKTGAIIRYASSVLSLYYEKDFLFALLNDFGQEIGLLFQITDDILEVTQTTEQLGKSQDSDQKNDKATYVSILSLDKAKECAQESAEKAKAILHKIEKQIEEQSSSNEKNTEENIQDNKANSKIPKTFFLREMVDYIVSRGH